MEYAVIDYDDLEISEEEDKRMEDVRRCVMEGNLDLDLLAAALDPWHHDLKEGAHSTLGYSEKREVELPEIFWLWLEGVGMVRRCDPCRKGVVDSVLEEAVFALSRELLREVVPEKVATADDWAEDFMYLKPREQLRVEQLEHENENLRRRLANVKKRLNTLMKETLLKERQELPLGTASRQDGETTRGAGAGGDDARKE